MVDIFSILVKNKKSNFMDLSRFPIIETQNFSASSLLDQVGIGYESECNSDDDEYYEPKPGFVNYIKDKYKNDWSKCYIELLMNYPCKNRKELEKKEFQILRKFQKNKNFKIINKNGIRK